MALAPAVAVVGAVDCGCCGGGEQWWGGTCQHGDQLQGAEEDERMETSQMKWELHCAASLDAEDSSASLTCFGHKNLLQCLIT